MTSILIASHHPALATGYARVVRQFADSAACAGHQVAVIGSIPPDQADENANLAGHSYEASAAPPGALTDAVKAFAARGERFDLLITIGDPWMFEGLNAAGTRPSPRWLALFPLDGGPIPRAWVRWMTAADERVVFSRFAQRLVADSLGREPRLLYHGVDTAVFRPMDKAAAKGRVVGDEAAFVVGCVAANQQRKNLPALVRAFAQFGAESRRRCCTSTRPWTATGTWRTWPAKPASATAPEPR